MESRLLCSHSQTVYNTKGTHAHTQRELIYIHTGKILEGEIEHLGNHDCCVHIHRRLIHEGVTSIHAQRTDMRAALGA